MIEGLRIRKMNLEDAKELERIQSLITKSSSKTDFRKIIQQQLNRDKDVSLVAEINGKVVGYMISYLIYAGFGIDKSAWIATFGIDPKFMGQGIGKKLAQETFKIYKKLGIKNIYTSVKWDSVDLLSFFKTLGFDRSEFINLHKQL
ncbi:MAG: GNAT family N-acetyltransferase [Deltaproteobacteria bacterium]|nr:MAG: GNAT family N-acetyltransferase [Deltaproteobacteria bacterium]